MSDDPGNLVPPSSPSQKSITPPVKPMGKTVFRATVFDRADKALQFRNLVPILIGLQLLNVVYKPGEYGDFAMYICTAITMVAARRIIATINNKFPQYEFGLLPVQIPNDISTLKLYSVSVKDCSTQISPKGKNRVIFTALKEQVEFAPALSMFIKAVDIPPASEKSTCKFFFATPEAALDLLGHVIRIESTEYTFTGDDQLIAQFVETLRPSEYVCVRVSKLNTNSYNLPAACGMGLQEYLTTTVSEDNELLDTRNLKIHCCAVKGKWVEKKYINPRTIIACITGMDEESLHTALRRLIRCSPINIGEAGSDVIVEEAPSSLFTALDVNESDNEEEDMATLPEGLTASQIYAQRKRGATNLALETATLPSELPAAASLRSPATVREKINPSQNTILKNFCVGLEQSLKQLAGAVQDLQRQVSDQDRQARETHRLAKATAERLEESRDRGKKARGEGYESDKSATGGVASMNIGNN